MIKLIVFRVKGTKLINLLKYVNRSNGYLSLFLKVNDNLF